MKTKSGLQVKDFKKLKTPIENGILEPHIYEGTILNVPTKTTHNETFRDFYCTWDKFGRCSNFNRQDCFIDVSKAE